MRRVTCFAIILCSAAGTTAAARGQVARAQPAWTAQSPKTPPPSQASPATQGPAIKWAASFDQAMKAMGADDRPVILYFTYDT